MIQNPSMLPNKLKYDLKSTNALFDKVINLRIRRAGGEKDLVIRSDYEVIENKFNRTYSIQRCSIKPQIRLSMNVVAGKVGTDLDIYITNFYVFNQEGKTSLIDFFYNPTNGEGNPFSSIDIIMGYAASFSKPATLEDYYNSVDVNRVPIGAQGIKVTSIHAVNVTSAPPDSVIHIHGWVNNIQKGFFKDLSQGVIEESALQNTEYFTYKDTAFGKPFAERVFEYLIQRRFVRDIDEWNRLPDKSKFLDKKTGFLNRTGAEIYGCRVFVPEGSSINTYKLAEYLGADGKIIKPDGVKIYLGAANSVAGTLGKLNKDFFGNTLRYAPLLDGNWVAWRDEDFLQGNVVQALNVLNDIAFSHSSGSSGAAIANLLDKDRALKVPLVYSVTASSGMCTVVCPFFTFINPFQKFKFNSRYNLSETTTQFTRLEENVFSFYATTYSIDFSTTGKENKMVINAIGLEKYR